MPEPETMTTQVTIVDIQMPFTSLVGFMLKCMVAAIPALLIFWLASAIFSGVIIGLFKGLV